MIVDKTLGSSGINAPSARLLDEEAPLGSSEPVLHAVLTSNYVAENVGAGTVIGDFVVWSGDGTETYGLELADDDEGRFALENGSLVVADGSRLDYEQQSAHVVVLKMTDPSGASFFRGFEIHLEDVPEDDAPPPPPPPNEAPADILLLNGTVREDALDLSVVGSLSATDHDGDPVQFTLVDDAGGVFSLQGDVVVVADHRKLDFESNPTHDIVVRATDSHGNATETTLTIRVLDVEEESDPLPSPNEPPMSVRLNHDMVMENSQAGAIVGMLDTVDPDGAGPYKYELLHDAGGRFALMDGLLVVKDGAALDFETDPVHTVTVRVTDFAGGVLVQDLQIRLLDDPGDDPHVPEPEPEPDPLPFPQPAVVLTNSFVLENTSSGTEIGRFALEGAPTGPGRVSVSLLDDAGGRFAIARQSGAMPTLVVADGTLIDYEARTSHSIRVMIKDDTGQESEETFTITVGDVDEDEAPPPPPAPPSSDNHAPSDIVLSDDSVLENSDSGTVVSLLLAKDVDPNETFTFTLLDNAGGRFAISEDELVVADGSRLDHEIAASHTVRIRVTDSHGASFDKAMTIHVDDETREAIDGTIGNDTLTGGAGNDVIAGGRGNDVITGGAGRDLLAGGTGQDRLFGGKGNDVITGGVGKDVVTGGAGKDVFVFDTSLGPANVDWITDFTVRHDTIHLAKQVFSGIGRKGVLAEDAFRIGSSAHDPDDRVIYDPRTGKLFFDPDGDGARGAAPIAILGKGLKMTGNDFLII